VPPQPGGGFSPFWIGTEPAGAEGADGFAAGWEEDSVDAATAPFLRLDAAVFFAFGAAAATGDAGESSAKASSSSRCSTTASFDLQHPMIRFY